MLILWVFLPHGFIYQPSFYGNAGHNSVLYHTSKRARATCTVFIIKQKYIVLNSNTEFEIHCMCLHVYMLIDMER
jgi:hypothetical protein